MRMMFVLILCALAQITDAQNRRYFERLYNSSLSHLGEAVEAGNSPIDVFKFNDQLYEQILYNSIYQLRVRKLRKGLALDSTLVRFAQFAINDFPTVFFRSKKYKERIVKYTDISLKRLNSPCNLFKVSAFSIDLCDIGMRNAFYFDRKDKSTDLRLFKGQKSRIRDPDHPDYEEPVPVQIYTETEFCANFMDRLKQELSLKTIVSRQFESCAIAIRLDKNSINTRKVPRAFVYLIFAGKQTQTIKRKRIPEAPESDSPYTILK